MEPVQAVSKPACSLHCISFLPSMSNTYMGVHVLAIHTGTTPLQAVQDWLCWIMH